ncbi:MAG TPA: heme biosynthesis protein HemY [Sedimenticola sp.]|nr:heme biosynthesis protein HemY [Sedimenticola sp.]
MKLLIVSLIAMAAAAALALVVQDDRGYILIGYGNWSLETSLAFFVLLVGALFVAFYVAVRIVDNLWTLPKRLRAWSARRSAEEARGTLNRGMVALSEGNWAGAEKTLVCMADHSETPLLNYLAAARSAQQQHALERRDHYLQLAHESMPSADVAIGLTQAELQLEDGELEEALETLRHLRSKSPKNVRVLRLLKTLHERRGDWQQLLELLPDLRKRHALDQEELQALEISVYGALLDHAAQDSDEAQLTIAWKKVPRGLRSNVALVERYARHLIARGCDEAAEKLLRNTLRFHWSESLVRLYGRIESNDPSKQLAEAEAWLMHHQGDPVLLMTLGQLSLRCRLWTKARGYLEASIEAGPSAMAYRELGALLEQMEEPEKAKTCYRYGLELGLEDHQPVLTPIEGQLLNADEEEQPEKLEGDADPKKPADVKILAEAESAA